MIRRLEEWKSGNGRTARYGCMDAWRHGNDKTTIIVKGLKILGSIILYSQRIFRF